MKIPFGKLLIFLLTTRLLMLVLPWLTIALLFPESSHPNFFNFTSYAWNRWDAPHYLYIAQNWYTNVGDEANFIVFFPLYPLIVKTFLTLLQAPVISAIFSSIIFFILGSYYFYRLVGIDFDKKIARLSVIYLSIFPTSFFFNVPYTESLFLLLFSSTLFYARRGSWIPSGILAGLGTLSRPFGILLLPTILIEWYLSKKRGLRYLPIIILPTIMAISSYIYLNNSVYGNPLEFQKVLATNWHKHFVSPIVSISDSWKIALSGGLTNFGLLVGWAEALTITLSWFLIPSVFKYLRLSWAVFYLLSIVLFSSTGFILSTPRYLLSVPPFFVLLALANKSYLFRTIWTFTSIGMLFCLSILFARGQWAF